MLVEFDIENFALIKSLKLSLDSGFTVITGETGAGKSLIIQALKIVLGAKVLPQYIRTGEEQAVVQAVFETPDRLGPFLETHGIPYEDIIIIRRAFSINGKGKIYVNGALVTLQSLRQITISLASLAGQHEYQELLRDENHALWLDRFAGLEADVSGISGLYQALNAAKGALDKVLTDKKSAEDSFSRSERDLKEIVSVAPSPGEDEALEQELKVLRAAAALREMGESCYRTIYAEKGAVIDRLAGCKADIERMSRIDQRLEKTLKDLASVIYQAEEVAFSIRDYLEGLPSDHLARLNETEERLHRLRELKKRFGPELADVLRHRDAIEKRLADIEANDDLVEVLKKEISEKESVLTESALALSAKRKEAAARLSGVIKQGLQELKFMQSEFEVEVMRPENFGPEDIGPRGMDYVRFMFSPNIGEPLRPLASVASGGELSRIMLAIRVALARESGMETIVFDEIDAGLGGEVALLVGRRLKNLAARGQVIAVTHFPQIAALADHHFTVTKIVEDGKTFTRISGLKAGDRLDEIARMLGGDMVSARGYAKELMP
ncbi:MAG: DNA repair protein RecN [Desulfobacteraceae bacterium]|nr:DNA repair protein RecN [Desulfobacteraceae bacterium]